MPDDVGQPAALSDEERAKRKKMLRDKIRAQQLAEIDWDDVRAAMEALVDTGRRDPILALAERLEPSNYGEISRQVMAPRKEAARQKRIEMVKRARERKEETERQALAASQRRARAHKAELLSMVRSELANLRAGEG